MRLRAWSLGFLVGCSAATDAESARQTDAAFSVGDLAAHYAWQSEESLGEGVWAVLGKGGNSVVVSDGETLIFDTKFDGGLFARGATSLKRWIDGQRLAPVTAIVNSHFHYDHTWGNALYPGADVYADGRSRGLMLGVDGDVWSTARAGLPTRTLGASTRLTVGDKRVEARLVGAGHTAGDAILVVPPESLGGAAAAVVATGDLVFHTYYPFFEEGESGSSLDGNVSILRALVEAFPDATFVPGHGPICTARDVSAYADYLDEMLSEIRLGLANGLGEEELVARVRPASRWRRLLLPSPHGGNIQWATADSSFRSAFRVTRARSAAR